MATEAVITDTVLIGILVVLAMVIVYLIVREIRIMKTANRTIELELKKGQTQTFNSMKRQRLSRLPGSLW